MQEGRGGTTYGPKSFPLAPPAPSPLPFLFPSTLGGNANSGPTGGCGCRSRVGENRVVGWSLRLLVIFEGLGADGDDGKGAGGVAAEIGVGAV